MTEEQKEAGEPNPVPDQGDAEQQPNKSALEVKQNDGSSLQTKDSNGEAGQNESLLGASGEQSLDEVKASVDIEEVKAPTIAEEVEASNFIEEAEAFTAIDEVKSSTVFEEVDTPVSKEEKSDLQENKPEEGMEVVGVSAVAYGKADTATLNEENAKQDLENVEKEVKNEIAVLSQELTQRLSVNKNGLLDDGEKALNKAKVSEKAIEADVLESDKFEDVQEAGSSEPVESYFEKQADSDNVFREVSEVNVDAEEEGQSANEGSTGEVNDGDPHNDWVVNGDPGDNWTDPDEAVESAQQGDDGEQTENVEEELDDDEIAGNPAYIPKSPRYYMHDSRSVEGEVNLGRNEARTSRADFEWKHDKFDERSQAPKSQGELMKRYGFDIRRKEKPEEGDLSRPVRNKSDSFKEEHNQRDENSRATFRGGRGSRGGLGRGSQHIGERPNRDTQSMRNGGFPQQQNRPNSTTSRGRGISTKGASMGRGSRSLQSHGDHDRTGEGKFRGQRDLRDRPQQMRRSGDHAIPRRGRGGVSSTGGGGSVSGGSGDHSAHTSGKTSVGGSGTIGGTGGGGKRYSKQRTAAAYGEQQRSAPLPLTTAPPEVLSPVNVPAAQPPRNPDWQRPPPPTFQPQIRPLAPIQPTIQPTLPPIPTVTPVAPTAFRAPNDTVYFDPSQQMIRGTAPPQPRAKKRLEIVSPGD